MALTVDGIFSLMPELFLPEKAQGLTVSVYYQVTGEGGGDYTCLIENGAFSLKREAKPDATSVVTIGAEDWIALNEGKLDPMQAFMTGKLKGTGDLGLLQKFPKFFKKPQKQGGPVKPLKDLVPGRLSLAGAGLKVRVGGESWGEGAEVAGDEAAVRSLLCGISDPGPSLLGGQLRFTGDMGLLRKAWKTWSTEPEITFPNTPGGKALATLRKRYKGGATGTLEVKVDGVPYRLDFSPASGRSRGRSGPGHLRCRLRRAQRRQAEPGCGPSSGCHHSERRHEPGGGLHRPLRGRCEPGPGPAGVHARPLQS